MSNLNKKQVGEYLLQMFDLSTHMDSSVIKNLMKFSHGINEPIDAVVECCLVDYFAKKAAESEYWDMPVSPAPAFQWRVNDDDTRELIRGEELMNILRLSYLWDIQQAEALKKYTPPSEENGKSMEQERRDNNKGLFEQEIGDLSPAQQDKLRIARAKDDELQKKWQKQRHESR